MSALRLIPVPAQSFASRLALSIFALILVALLMPGGLGTFMLRRSLSALTDRLAQSRLDSVTAQLADASARHATLVKRLASEPFVVKAARKLAVPRPRTEGPTAFTEGERSILTSRLSPHHQLEPGGELARRLQERVALDPGAISALVTEASGVIVAATQTPPQAIVSEERWWKAGRNDVHLSLSGAAPTVTRLLSVAVPIEDPADKERVGVLQMTFAADDVSRSLLGGERAAASGRAAIFDGRGEAVPATPPAGVRLEADEDFRALGPELEKKTEATVRTASSLAWGRRLTSPGLDGWIVAVAFARNEVDGPVGTTVLSMTGLAILILIGSALVTFPFLSRTTHDLTALVDYARRTGAGDASATPPRVKRSDEIGTLGTALVSSLESLRSSRAELERAKKTLEERVEARTSELARVNQELKRRAEELAAASKSKDEFLTNISHELRTPLNSIIGLTQLVRDGLTDTPEESQQFLDQALVSSRHLLTLINDVLDLAKLEAGKVVLELDDVPAGEVVDEVAKIVGPLANQKRLKLELTVPQGIPLVRADRIRLRQVLVNIAQNAIKFTSEGKVSMRVRTSDGRRKLLFEVEDTGIGIPPEKRQMVFEKFIQAEAGTTRRFGGTGLGLPISRLLVEAMNGAIGIESGADNVGTRVWFTIPTPTNLEGR